MRDSDGNEMDDDQGAGSPSEPPAEAAALRRRNRQLTVVVAVALVVVAVLAGVVAVGWAGDADETAGSAGSGDIPAGRSDVEALLAGLDDRPVDPTEVQLVSSVSTFADCDALTGDLRRVGAEHVGSRGFGAMFGIGFTPYGAFDEVGRATDHASAAPASQASDGGDGAGVGTTLGTNVQVEGVDELDHVKAVGNLIYDLDGEGHLRITDAGSLEVVSRVDVTPEPLGGGEDDTATAHQLLAEEGRVVVFGTETEVSEPVEGDPSATRATTSFLTVTFVDTADVAEPVVSDRVRVEGRLVSARLVDGQIRLVTTSDMADLGFVMPTTPTSVAKALEQNRRSVAVSSTVDWIPDWQRAGADPTPLVPCERVHVPDTFAGVAMTSMVTFPIGSGTFEPAATSILAPGDTLYAGLEKVAISSGVWVDPIDRDRLRFDDWQTAVHEFSFAEGAAPGYEGSGIVDGSTVGQFAFGEIGESLAVVTTVGTPWAQDTSRNAVDLVVLAPDGHGALDRSGDVEDLADGEGAVSAVRFVEGRVLVSTGVFGQEVRVVDVSDPSAPRKAGEITVPGPIGYFHPLPEDRALLVGSRTDEVGAGDDIQWRSWVQAHLLDVSDADAPQIVSTWERPWSVDQIGADHHAFTFWPERDLALWGLRDTQITFDETGPPNHAAVLRVHGEVSEVAVPVANEPNETPPPCPEVAVTEPEMRAMIGPDSRVLRCDDGGTGRVDWPRHQCHRVDPGTVARFVPDAQDGEYVICNPAPQPAVSRVLVVDGRPILLTDQTLEALDPETFASTQVAYHPSERNYLPSF
ncbi:beta-propeller domain-containing protein [Rhabdothermincola salaria]|uniref:beta-propeller domain-containing protein n=1 Tax=Rhabdothermincola salaria TaxID=2903142 RepID=UPI001E62FE12|nr:beta-propeller domain-containing protein [Rhabdothermincola salaria]MCD9624193.1 beta-propeller domain-containing protein [Rhabdothermincola salaria]